MTISKRVAQKLEDYPELKIIDAEQLYQRHFKGESEFGFYKALSRMAEDKELIRIAKGLYCKPKNGRLGPVISSEKEILEHYVGSKSIQGVIVGYRMYYRYGLTTQISKTIEVYSRLLHQETRKITNIKIKKINLRLNPEMVKLIELLDVLEHYGGIEDLNRGNLKLFLEQAVASYHDQTLHKLVKSIGYKKRTLASLERVLDYYQVANSVGCYLKDTSRYQTIRMDDLEGFTGSSNF